MTRRHGGDAPGSSFRSAEAGSGTYCLLATLGGIVIPTVVAVDVAFTLGSRVHSSGAGRALVVAGIVVAALVVATLVALVAQVAWRWAGLPESGMSDFLPHRWVRRRMAGRRAERRLAAIRALPPDTPIEEVAERLAGVADALAAADSYERGRPERRETLAEEMAERLGWSQAQIIALRLAATVQDLGMAEIPAA
ncbi:MAG TPA: hypothetical protein VKY26_08650, partial [Actinomycetota bacterium]|nr:hypothetical protein [Actinomycetota bacterium]